MHDSTRRRTHDEHGSGMLAVIVLVIICAALAAGVLLPSMARHREAEAHAQRQRALYLAEAGVDWAIAVLRESHGIVPGARTVTQSPQGQGSFTLTYTPGNTNGVDDDGDGIVDEPQEDAWVTLLSVGASGNETRAIQVLLRAAMDDLEFPSSVVINVDAPVFDSTSHSLTVDGRDHDKDGAVDLTGPFRPALASPAPVADLESQISNPSQFIGLGGTPSVAQVPAMDLVSVVAQAQSAATRIVQPGTHAGISWGTPTVARTEIVYCDGDLHLSGNGTGAGYLVVDGDLIISGSFLWQGAVVVRGRTRMTGGGGTKRIIGALAVGEEIETVGAGGSVQLSGTVDLKYSVEALDIANRRIAIMSIQAWSEVPSP